MPAVVILVIAVAMYVATPRERQSAALAIRITAGGILEHIRALQDRPYQPSVLPVRPDRRLALPADDKSAP